MTQITQNLRLGQGLDQCQLPSLDIPPSLRAFPAAAHESCFCLQLPPLQSPHLWLDQVLIMDGPTWRCYV